MGSNAAPPSSQQQQQHMSEQANEQLLDQKDCMGCRVTGLMLGLGGCGYLSSRLWVDPKPVGAHRYAILASSAALFVLGVGRAVGAL